MAKPIVDGIENQLGTEADVIRINALSDVGRDAVAYFGVRALPTLIIVDGCGSVVERIAGIPNARTVTERVRSVPACSPDLP
nr:thioredoxin family protein [Anaerolineae bacterium]